MSSCSHSTFNPVRVKRSATLAALMSAVMLAGPFASARAQTAADAPAHHTGAARHVETVEQRIASLHAALKITPAEESDWQAVAQTMRDNAAAMRKLEADDASQARQGMTAIEDLQAYAQFAQAHVDGMKSLLASFTTLYNSMPDQQKKVADQVFQNARRHGADGPG